MGDYLQRDMGRCVLEDSGHRVIVEGRLQDGGPVTVVVDDERHVITRDSGHVDEGAVTVTLRGDDGLHVKEAAVTQQITLPDGTYIKRGAVTARATLADGTMITDTSGTEEAYGEPNVTISVNGETIHADSSGGSTTVEASTSGETVIRQQTSSAEADDDAEEDDEEEEVETPAAFFQAALAVFFGGLFAELVFGVGPGLLGAAGVAGTVYYGLASGYHAIGDTSGDADTVINGLAHVAGFAALAAGTVTGAFGVPAAVGAGLFAYFGLHAAHSGLDAVLPGDETDGGDADLDGVREELADLQAEYLDADGDVESIDEYEARVSEILDGRDVDAEDIEVARVPETETA